MAAKIFYQEDCDLSLLDGKKIAIIGYGSQGHAHALNLKESGCDVIVGLYEGSKSWAKAEKQGLKVYPHAFVPQCQLQSRKPPSLLVFLLISTHFTATLGIPLSSPALKFPSFKSLLRLSRSLSPLT